MATGQLPLESVIGFEGKVNGGLVLHPNGKTMIYPLGATIVIKELGDAFSQSFLQGHSDEVSCLTLSADGRYLASGQITYMGFTADIIVWDLDTRAMVHRMSLHKVKVQALTFSYDGKYLASLGGQDDNSLVIWDVETGNAICGSPTSNEQVTCVKFLSNTNTKLATGGHNNLDVWDFDRANRKIRPTNCRLGQLRRICNSITVDEYVSAACSPRNPRPRPVSRRSTTSFPLGPPLPSPSHLNFQFFSSSPLIFVPFLRSDFGRKTKTFL